MIKDKSCGRLFRLLNQTEILKLMDQKAFIIYDVLLRIVREGLLDIALSNYKR